MKFYEEKGFSLKLKDIEDKDGNKLDFKSIKIRKYESLILYHLNYKLDFLLCDRINKILYYLNSFFTIEEINQFQLKSSLKLHSHNEVDYIDFLYKKSYFCFKFSVEISKSFVLNNLNYILYTHEDISFCSILISKKVFGFYVENEKFSSRLVLEYLFDTKVNQILFDSITENYKNKLDLSEYENYY